MIHQKDVFIVEIKKKHNKKFLIVIIIGLLISLCTIVLAINYFKQDDIYQTNERDESVLQVEVITEYINIREESNSQSELLGKVYEGEIYTIIDKNPNETWYLIETDNGIRGYIYKGDNDNPYFKELPVIGDNNNSNNDGKEENSTTDKNQNNTSNNTSKPNNNSKPNNSSKPNVNQDTNNNEQTNNTQEKEEPKLPACLKTCDEGYELKDANSVNCYCEKKQETYISKNQVIYNNDGVIITVKGLDYSNKSWVTLDLHITNNSSVAKTIQKNSFPYVNGYDIATNYSVTLLPGTSSTHGMTFLNKYLEKNGSTIIKTIKLNFSIIDWDGNYETLHGSKTVKTPWIDLSF